MNKWKLAAGGIACMLFTAGNVHIAKAATYEAETPVAGIAITINNYNARLEATAYISGNEKEITMAAGMGESISGVTEAASAYDNIAVSRVTDYVNVRSIPSTDGEVVGKIYDGCAATILETQGDWYKIESGNVKGYIKAEFFVTGEEAEALVPVLATKYATVNTTTLNVRAGAGMDYDVVATVPYGEEFVIIEEKDGWARMELDAAVSGWVSLDYLNTRVEFDTAISIEEEAQKAAEAEAARQRAEEARQRAEEEARANQAALEAARLEAESIAAAKAEAESIAAAQAEAESLAAAKAEAESRAEAESIAEAESLAAAEAESIAAAQAEAESFGPSSPQEEAEPETEAPFFPGAPGETEPTETEPTEPETETPSAPGISVNTSNTALREAIVAYAVQFVGNPYVYGGNSLTNGTDCSGFVKLIYQEFGYSLERRASYQYKYNGTQIAISDIQPGDLIFYGTSEVDHVALYMGNNQVVHASTEKTGIKISTLSYRDIYGAVSILE